MSAHKHAVAWSAGHVCRHTYKIKPAAADTEQRHEAEHNEQNATKAQTPPRRGEHTNGVKKTHSYSQSDVKRVRAHHLGLANDSTL